MLEGQAAVTAYGRGVALLRNELVEAKKNGEEVLQKTIRQQIAAAHASVAELYMTDLCFADDAEVGGDSAVTFDTACIVACAAADFYPFMLGQGTLRGLCAESHGSGSKSARILAGVRESVPSLCFSRT